MEVSKILSFHHSVDPFSASVDDLLLPLQREAPRKVTGISMAGANTSSLMPGWSTQLTVTALLVPQAY